MTTSQRTALIGLVVLGIGSLAITGGSAWYYRSAAYARRCAAVLEQMAGLPAEIEQVRPRSLDSQEFVGINIWLPERRARALRCERALLRYVPDGAPDAYEIEAFGGMAEISTATWLREDLRTVVERGLRPGFEMAGPEEIRFSGMRLRCEAGGFTLELGGASGRITFDHDGAGRAGITCATLNGRTVDEPVVLSAAFTEAGADSVRIDDLLLTVPTLPVAGLRLDEVLGGRLSAGTFAGELRYREEGRRRVMALAGQCRSLDLAELTAPWLAKPWGGRCETLRLDEWRVVNRRSERVRFAGALKDVTLDDVLAPLGLSGGGGTFDLQVREAVLTPMGIARLSARGTCPALDLQQLSRALGYGEATGKLRITIEDLVIEDNRLARLRADLRVVGSPEPPNWIEGEVLRRAVSAALGIELPDMLPRRVPYRQLGVRLDVRDEQLYVLGTHGDHDRAILTADVGGVAMPLVLQPEQPIDLRPWLDALRAQAEADVRTRLEAIKAATTQPAMNQPTAE